MPRWLMWESAACCKIACCSAWPVFPWVHLCTAVREAAKLELTVMQNTLQGVWEFFSISAWAPCPCLVLRCINNFLL